MALASQIQSSTTSQPVKRDLDLTQEDMGFEGAADEPNEDAVHFCLLAEFDIDAGATLAHQYPYPTGTDEQYV